MQFVVLRFKYKVNYSNNNTTLMWVLTYTQNIRAILLSLADSASTLEPILQNDSRQKISIISHVSHAELR